MTPRSSSVPLVGKSPLVGGAEIVRKPRALSGGGRFMPFGPASPAEPFRIAAGIAELVRLGFRVADRAVFANDGYFAGLTGNRRDDFTAALERHDIDALVGARGGYGSNYILDGLEISTAASPKIILGFSDLTSLHIFMWQRCRWITFHGPMLAAGLDAGANVATGYDQNSLLAALQKTKSGWVLDLDGETLTLGEAQGRLLGGCLTLVETTIGTPWELETDGAILVLEDRGMKPWQVDRALMHLSQAGKFEGVRGILLGDFPECESPVPGSPTVRDVCRKILSPLSVPVIFGAPVGHTVRPALTLPLGVNARLSAKGEGVLEILEPAVVS
jgi:muramoyltetrapeptide carboxypeptidase